MVFDKEWKKFMIQNKKWDSKKGEMRFPKPNEYHNKLKTVWKKSARGGFNPEKGENGYWQNVHDGYEIGPILFDYCQLCGKNLKEMRDNGGKVIKFCCKDHSIEYSKRRKILKDKFGEENNGLSWHTKKGEKIFREDIKVNLHGKDGFKEFPLKAKKSKWGK